MLTLRNGVLFIRSCHDDAILTRKSHKFTGTAFPRGNSAGGSKLNGKTFSLGIRWTLSLFVVPEGLFENKNFVNL